MRPDGRQPEDLRPVRINRDVLKYAEGSVLIEMGDTKLICSASVEDKVPPFLKGQGRAGTASTACCPVPQEYARTVSGAGGGRSEDPADRRSRGLLAGEGPGRAHHRIGVMSFQADGDQNSAITGILYLVMPFV